MVTTHTDDGYTDVLSFLTVETALCPPLIASGVWSVVIGGGAVCEEN